MTGTHQLIVSNYQWSPVSAHYFIIRLQNDVDLFKYIKNNKKIKIGGPNNIGYGPTNGLTRISLCSFITTSIPCPLLIAFRVLIS